MSRAGPRRGVACCGSWIVDHVKIVNRWPREETLADILSETAGTGGSACNVSLDLARFDLGLPLCGLGVLGDDRDGERILAGAARSGIDTRHMRRAPGVSTAYTDVVTVQSTGRRTFFHHRGSNAIFAPEHVPVADLRCRILSLGYLLLLDAMDAPDPRHGTAAAGLLASCRAAGMQTAVDAVSEDSDRFRAVIGPALRHTDHLIVNEIEAARTAGHAVPAENDRQALLRVGRDLLELGVNRLVVIHTPRVAVALPRDGEPVWRPSLCLPEGFVQGSAGAGDAFFAGMLAGLHEGWALERCLDFAHGAAAASLRHPTCTGGVSSAAEIWRLRDAHPPAA